MSDDGRQAIWTPGGVRVLGGQPLRRVELRPALMEWLVQMSDFAEYQNIGMHCSLCGADLVGKNGQSDKTFSVACNCREWVGGNRDYREPKVS